MVRHRTRARMCLAPLGFGLSTKSFSPSARNSLNTVPGSGPCPGSARKTPLFTRNSKSNADILSHLSLFRSGNQHYNITTSSLLLNNIIVYLVFLKAGYIIKFKIVSIPQMGVGVGCSAAIAMLSSCSIMYGSDEVVILNKLWSLSIVSQIYLKECQSVQR
jgi:hypothetical protein